MPPAGFEPIIPAGERPQTYTLDRAATETDIYSITCDKLITQVPLEENSTGLFWASIAVTALNAVESHLKTELGERKSKEYEPENPCVLYKPFLTIGPQCNDPKKYADMSLQIL